jgi:hypothetical protein
MSQPPERPAQESPITPDPVERSDNWLTILFKVVLFLVVGTIGLGVLFFGTCLLLMRH